MAQPLHPPSCKPDSVLFECARPLDAAVSAGRGSQGENVTIDVSLLGRRSFLPAAMLKIFSDGLFPSAKQ
jgi:hypothetical protein